MNLRPSPILHVLGLLAVLASGCDVAIRGNGEPATETRNLAGFSAITHSAGIDVDVTVGAADGPRRVPAAATLRCDANLIGRIDTVVEDGTLHVRLNDDDIELAPRTPCELEVTTARLDAVSIEGPSTLVAHGIASDRLAVDVEGPAELVLAGVVDRLDAQLEGPVELDADGLAARVVELYAEGPAEASVRASEQCVLDIEGPVEVTVFGDPSTRDVTTEGPTEVHFR